MLLDCARVRRLTRVPRRCLLRRRPLYDKAALGGPDGPPVAALVSYEDIYVERAFSEQVGGCGGGPRVVAP
mgnify:CR=1 FL=1